MSMTSTELKKYVADDIKKYDGVRRPLKAGRMERHFGTKIDPAKLHPNPTDAFTWPQVGPSDKIVAKYMKQILDGDGIEKPIMVEKMFPDGYELINGHHRWAAAMRCGLNSVPIRIVNLTHEEDILKMLEQSKRTMRATFDLDEVLLVSSEDMPQEPGPKFPYNRQYKERLRKGAPDLLNELQRMGFDIWVYTKTVLSEEDIRRLFKGYGVKLDGCINGLGKKSGEDNNQRTLKSSNNFLGRYQLTVHVDDASIIFTTPKTKGFDIQELSARNYDWVIQVLQKVKEQLIENKDILEEGK